MAAVSQLSADTSTTQQLRLCKAFSSHLQQHCRPRPAYTPIAQQAGKPSSRTYCSPRPDRWCSWALVRDRDVTTLAVAHISSSASDNVDPGDALRTQRQPWNWSRGPSSDSAVDVEVSRGSPKAGPPPPPPAGMPPVHWQSRTLGHLQQQCGRFLLRSP